MRLKFIFFIMLSLLVSGANAQSFFNSGSSQEPVIEWEKTMHDFGEVPMGVPVSFTFKFKNTSLKPVIIQEVEASCDCTAAEYPKQPIKPGETAKIVATYKADEKGAFFKSITVTANTKTKQHILKMTGVVVD
ncbi:MAG: hypothetical protein A2W91_03445 [Bacteroidetes bacterium GWF2_38_335]|nr:MAG: hypothetical protein A2W91_03445 [Bacteroidetes bacterium GWF2_38_335]OFY77461.1 MAG: hypothetical protein A2281_01315 [Bacteroidetes bacterium RIFOXYA12_FULL_38_20]